MGAPPNPFAAEGVALVASGMTPEDAADQLRREGKAISSRTIRRGLPPGGPSALVGSLAPPRQEAAREEQPARKVSSVRSTITTAPSGRAANIPRRGSPPEPVEKGKPSADRPIGARDIRENILGPSLPAPKLAELRDLVGRLPFAQQDHLVTTLPLERLRREAIVRGLARYHDAAAAVARELRAVRL